MKPLTNNYAVSVIIIFCFFLAFSPQAYSQAGCTDPLANNYNSSALTNDGSCTYNTTFYTPPVKVNPVHATLTETSGLQWAGGHLWSFNDGGGAAAIYRIDTITNTIFQTVNLTNATNVDWEDIAFDGTYFYVGDFGNNLTGGRTDLKIYKFPISEIDPDFAAHPVINIPGDQIEVINFNYIDQKPIVPTTNYNTKYDCEAMIIDEGKIHLFTKNWIDNNTTHYIINSLAAGTYEALNVETLPTGFLVTGADKAVGKNVIALLGYQAAIPGNHFMEILSDYSEGEYFNGNKRKINLPNVFTMGQAEGITFRNGTYGYISNESVSGSIAQKLYSFDINSFVPASVLALELKDFSVSNINGTHKIEWNFVSPVEKSFLQASDNSIHFTTLKSFDHSASSVFYNKPANPVTYYRISWLQNDEATQYSKIVAIKKSEKEEITNLHLTKKGELTFTLNGNTRSDYSFKLVMSDGKMLSAIPYHSYQPGINKTSFLKPIVLNGLVYITAFNGKNQLTKLVQIEN